MLEATESNYFHPRFVQSFYTLAFQPKNPITGPFISDPDLRSNFDYFHLRRNEGVQPGPSEIFLGIENRWNPPGCPVLREKLIFFLNEKMLCTVPNKTKLTKRALTNWLHTNSQVLELNFGHNGVRFSEENKFIRTDDLG